MKIILQKLIAQSGYCSRRAAEVLINRGQVKLNGRAAEPGATADTDDRIEIRGQIIGAPKDRVYIKLNKPTGYTCTTRRFAGEKNIFELSDNWPRGLFSIGRLDKNSHGLLLLTNDGDLTLKLTHPRSGLEKIYEVRVAENVKPLTEQIALKARSLFLKGIPLNEDEGIAKAKAVKYLQNGLFLLTLTEGKKREIRRMFDYADLKVMDLKRISFAGIELGNLPEGKWGYLSKVEVEKLKRM
jgi:pseudouridine synthase